MRKQRIEYQSPVDALVAIAKRLNSYEARHHLESEEFYDKFCKGLLGDERDFIEWSNAYQHYLALKSEIDSLFRQCPLFRTINMYRMESSLLNNPQ